MKTTMTFFLMTLSTLAFSFQPAAGDDIQTFYTGPRTKKIDPDRHLDDRGFIRRLYLDLTGRLPDPETVEGFIADNAADKRRKLVDEVLAGDAWADRWTFYIEEMLGSHRILDQGEYLRPFHFTLRKMVGENRSWAEIATYLLTYSGTGMDGDNAFLIWVEPTFESDFRLDFLDDQIGKITETMLGVSTDCISCHDGAYHLEEINSGLSTMTRQQFWGMAAFLSSSYLYAPRDDYDWESEEGEQAFYRELQYVDMDHPDFERAETGFFFTDWRFEDGEYRAQSRSGEGMRAPRNGGVVQPAYLFSGEQPRSGETRRRALARMITEDRQFARNMVNRLWAHFFGEGFVEPLTGWDLGRIDASSAAAFDKTVQPRNLDLMEHLTDVFIGADYDLKALMRHLCNSWLYQLDYASLERGGEEDRLGYWMSNRRVRRLEAQAVVDSMFQILETGHRYAMTGVYDRSFQSTWQMPDSYEPNPGALYDYRTDGLIVDPGLLGFPSEDHYWYYQYSAWDLLRAFGAGDRADGVPVNTENSIQTALVNMNLETIHFWTVGEQASPLVQGLIQAAERGASAGDLTRAMFRRILFREPTETEITIFENYLQGKETDVAVPDMVWSLMNHPDFIHK
ncbi:MAG: DUF1553 domain-containing protein [Acidobacteriota bacterium]|nr:DUF1553 domain-containing protein [Acidobacteriota bacterium]